MTTTVNPNVAFVKARAFVLGIANDGIGNAITADFPQAIAVTNVRALTSTAFDGTGTVTATATDGTTAFVDGVDVKTTGIETIGTNAKHQAAGTTISAYITDQNADSTEGTCVVIVEYVELNGCDQVYG